MTPEQIEEMKRDAARVPELEAEVLRQREVVIKAESALWIAREVMRKRGFGIVEVDDAHAEVRAALEGKQ